MRAFNQSWAVNPCLRHLLVSVELVLSRQNLPSLPCLVVVIYSAEQIDCSRAGCQCRCEPLGAWDWEVFICFSYLCVSCSS